MKFDSVFRIQQHVPEVYPDRSRDFQLFCRLYDSVMGGVKYSIDSLSRTSTTMSCDATLLELLKTKLGLFTTVEATEKELRYVLSVFPILIRYKGSKLALDYVLNLYCRLANVPRDSIEYDESALNGSYELIIRSQLPLKSASLLEELLTHVLPTGYVIKYNLSQAVDYTSTISVTDQLNYYPISSINDYSVVKGKYDGQSDDIYDPDIYDAHHDIRDSNVDNDTAMERWDDSINRTVGVTLVENVETTNTQQEENNDEQ